MADATPDDPLIIPADEPAPAAAAPPDDAPKISDTDAALEKLGADLRREREARQRADAEADRARQEAAAARTETASSQLSLVTTAITSVTQAIDAQEAQYAAALAAGDHAAAAKINREMGANQAKLTRLEEGKQQMERAPKAAPEAPRRAADPVEDFVSRLQGPRRERAAEWIRSHAEFVTDKAKEARLYAAHNLAMADGHEPNTDDYFAAVEDALKLRQPTRVTDEDPPPETPRRSSPPAAPVSRSGGGNGTRREGTRATAAQIEAAEISGVSLEEYMKNDAILRSDKRYN